MRALRYHTIGATTDLRLEEVAVPVPEAGEIAGLGAQGASHRHGVMPKPDAALVDEVLGYATEGRLRCAIEQEFALQDALAAIERSRTGRVLGKVVVAIA